MGGEELRGDKTGRRKAVWSVMLDRGFGKRWMRAALVFFGLLFCGVLLYQPRPVAGFADKKAQGAELFATRGCAHCHGDDGQGTDRAPGLHNLRKKMKADAIQNQIVHGGQGMPAFEDSLKPDEVEDLVSFLRAKQWISPPKSANSTTP